MLGTADIQQIAVPNFVNFIITDGITPKNLFSFLVFGATGDETSHFSYDFIFFLDAGENFEIFSSSTTALAFGSIRQIADNNGTLVQPVGFNPS